MYVHQQLHNFKIIVNLKKENKDCEKVPKQDKNNGTTLCEIPILTAANHEETTAKIGISHKIEFKGSTIFTLFRYIHFHDPYSPF